MSTPGASTGEGNGRAAAPWSEEELRRVHEEGESRTAKAMERLVATAGFSEALSLLTDNVVTVQRVFADAGDLVLRNLRLAGRSDLARLARRLNETEDTLEELLRRVERLRDDVGAEPR